MSFPWCTTLDSTEKLKTSCVRVIIDRGAPAWEVVGALFSRAVICVIGQFMILLTAEILWLLSNAMPVLVLIHAYLAGKLSNI